MQFIETLMSMSEWDTDRKLLLKAFFLIHEQEHSFLVVFFFLFVQVPHFFSSFSPCWIRNVFMAEKNIERIRTKKECLFIHKDALGRFSGFEEVADTKEINW